MRRVLAVIAVATALAGCSSQLTPAPAPSHPAVTVFNLLPQTIAVSGPGQAEVSVACGAQIQLHPQGVLPWQFTVHAVPPSVLPSISKTIQVHYNPAVIVAEHDTTGRPIVDVSSPHTGAHPICSSRP